MKKILLCLIGSLLISAYSFSQDFCSTESWYQNDLESIDTYFVSANGPYSVRVFFHIIRRTKGTGGQDADILPTCLDILNNDFAAHNINFKSVGSDFIDSDRFFAFIPTDFDLLTTTNSHIDAFDIYILPPNVYNAGRANGIPGTALVIGGNGEFGNINTSLPVSHVLSHEMGHCLGLFHTFHGTYSKERNASTCPELVDGSNGESCGDFVLDTPADPVILFKQELGNECKWNNTDMKDSNGQLYDPDETLIMAYSYPQCYQSFTFGQGERMRQSIALTSFLQNRIIPADLYVHNETFSLDQPIILDANNSISAGRSVTTGVEGDVVVKNNADLTLRAGNTITLKPGLKVEAGSLFYANITPGTNKVSAKLRAISTDYNRFLENTSWFVAFRGFEPPDDPYIYETIGDTIINNELYTNINEYDYDVINQQKSTPIDLFIIKEDLIGKKIYRYSPYCNCVDLLYDFNLSEGNRLATDSSFVLSKIDTVEFEGVKRKRYEFTKPLNATIVWIEGIGNIANPFRPTAAPNEFQKLICVKKNQEVIYDAGSFYDISCSSYVNSLTEVKRHDILVYPNPSIGVFRVKNEDPNEPILSVTIVNGKGQVISTIKNIAITSSLDIDLSLQTENIFFCIVQKSAHKQTFNLLKY